jgi:hypothetical protein
MKKELPTWVIILIVVFAIILFVITVGWFFPPNFQDKRVPGRNDEEKEAQRRKEWEKKRNNHIEDLEKSKLAIKQSELKLEKIAGRERWLLFASRCGIAVFLVFADIIYFKFFGWSELDLAGQWLKVSSFYVAVYSCIAFISHGTPGKFAFYLKSHIRSLLKWYHRSDYEAHDMLLFHHELITTTISSMEKLNINPANSQATAS